MEVVKNVLKNHLRASETLHFWHTSLVSGPAFVGGT